MKHSFLKLTLSAVCLLSAVAGCGSTGAKSANADMDSAPGGPTLDEYKEQLRQIVYEDIVSARNKADESGADLQTFKPYYYKEFHDYPEGPDAFEITFVEQDSKTAPLLADVTVTKLRFTTDVQRDRNAARVDDDFQREKGTETISYELRNGRWHRMASLFVASELSSMMGGEWVPREEEPRDEFESFDEREGWFRRTWNKFRIGEEPSTTAP